MSQSNENRSKTSNGNTENVVYLRTAVVIGALILVAVLLISTIALTIMSISLKSQVNSQTENISAMEDMIDGKNPLSNYEFGELSYQSLYPNLYANAPKEFVEREKTVFLTFDDGPSTITSEILDILKSEEVAATFFVVGNENEESKALMKRIVDEGHKIAVHTYSHDYDKVYTSVESYLEDFDKVYNLIYEATGVRTDIFRFLGGSVNVHNVTNNVEISAELLRRGFVYYDWNVSSGDASQGATKESVIESATSSEEDRIILFMHDSESKTYTAAALPDIIKHYKNAGYNFASLENTDKPVALNAK